MTILITTKYLAPTNTKGARIKAESNEGVKVTKPYDYSKNTLQNHEALANELGCTLGYRKPGEYICETKTGNIFKFEG